MHTSVFILEHRKGADELTNQRGIKKNAPYFVYISSLYFPLKV